MPQVQLDRLLETAVRVGATDVFLVPGRPPVLRVDGALRWLETAVLKSDDLQRFFAANAPEAVRAQLEARGFAQWAFPFGEKARFRARVSRHSAGLEVAFRPHPAKPPAISDLGLPPIVHALCRRRRGLFLVAGPAGAGKTTVLASFVDYINLNVGDRRIGTFEPVTEFVHRQNKCLVAQWEIPLHVPDVPAALAHFAAADGDVILLGDITDPPVRRAALQRACLDTLVLAEWPEGGVQAALNRWIDSVPIAEQERVRWDLGLGLVAVLHCQLLPRRDGGQVLAYEFLVHTQAISNLVRENKLYRIDSAIQTGRKFGMQLLDEHLWQLFRAESIDTETAVEHARNPSEMQWRIDNFRRGGPDASPGDSPDAPQDPDPFPVRPKRPPPEMEAHADPDPAEPE